MQEEYATRRELIVACLSGDTRHVRLKRKPRSPSGSSLPLVLPTDLAKLVQSYVGDYDDSGVSQEALNYAFRRECLRFFIVGIVIFGIFIAVVYLLPWRWQQNLTVLWVVALAPTYYVVVATVSGRLPGEFPGRLVALFICVAFPFVIAGFLVPEIYVTALVAEVVCLAVILPLGVWSGLTKTQLVNDEIQFFVARSNTLIGRAGTVTLCRLRDIKSVELLRYRKNLQLLKFSFAYGWVEVLSRDFPKYVVVRRGMVRHLLATLPQLLPTAAGAAEPLPLPLRDHLEAIVAAGEVPAGAVRGSVRLASLSVFDQRSLTGVTEIVQPFPFELIAPRPVPEEVASPGEQFLYSRLPDPPADSSDRPSDSADATNSTDVAAGSTAVDA